ncbi:unnamed protein product [Caenorhabditis angaria]|uniref:Uncharacterized protein n=1 Tax=Caenorhabditis angaria TaxID=860376 RepID=A0A9P1IED3_9PELO|nr:unnamed protein product [Caenorhabditis angaria]
MAKVKGVVYDFGGVLLSYDNVLGKWHEMSEALGLEPEVMHREAVGTEFSKWLGPDRSLFLGTLTVDELENGLFVEFLKQKYGEKINANVQVRPYSECLRPPNAKFHEKMVKSVEVLHENGFKTAMLTNNMFIDEVTA